VGELANRTIGTRNSDLIPVDSYIDSQGRRWTRYIIPAIFKVTGYSLDEA
jgi:hypothetical protein